MSVGALCPMVHNVHVPLRHEERRDFGTFIETWA